MHKKLHFDDHYHCLVIEREDGSVSSLTLTKGQAQNIIDFLYGKTELERLEQEQGDRRLG